MMEKAVDYCRRSADAYLTFGKRRQARLIWFRNLSISASALFDKILKKVD